MRKKSLLVLAPLLVSVLACQTVVGLWPGQPTHTPTPSNTLSPTPSLTPIPPSATPSFTPTQPPYTPTPTSTHTPRPTASPLQFQVFEELWGVIDENYLYPDFNGQDWDEIGEEYRELIQAGLSDDEFYLLMQEMVFRLGDEHSAYFSPQQAAELDAEYAGEHNYVGIGVLTVPVPERDRITIIAIFPGSPAEQAGLQLHDSILAAAGEPILDEDGFIRRDLLLGPEGTIAELTVQTPGQSPRQVQIARGRVSGGLPVFHTIASTPDGKRVGYILLLTFNDSTVDDQVRGAMQEMTAGAPLDGLIIDNRFNSGGASEVLKEVISLFTNGVLGHFVSRERNRPLTVSGVDLGGSQNMPLVVLVGPGTVSFGEIFAGVLQDLSRAFLIGEPTDGNVEILHVYDFSDGSRAWIAEETFRPLNQPEADWELTGISPNLTVESRWDEVGFDDDPVIQAALEYFDK